MTNIPKFQIHHILPIEVFNNYGLKIEEIMGDDKSLQSYNNGGVEVYEYFRTNEHRHKQVYIWQDNQIVKLH